MQLDQDTLYALLAVGIMLLVGFPVHEFSHAFAAYRLGDSTARWQGRLTLDPRVHFDQVGGLMLVISAIISNGSFFFGYAKPTPVNPMDLTRSVIATWPVAVLANIAVYFVLINTFLFIFNLLPVPPLDGWKVLGGLVSPQMAWQMRNLERQYAQIIPLIFLGVILLAGGKIILPIADFVLNLLLGNSGYLFPVIR